MVLTRSQRKPPETPEGLEESETHQQEVVVEPDSGLGKVSEAETEVDTRGG